MDVPLGSFCEWRPLFSGIDGEFLLPDNLRRRDLQLHTSPDCNVRRCPIDNVYPCNSGTQYMPSRPTVLKPASASWTRIRAAQFVVALTVLLSGCGSQLCPAGDVVTRDPLLRVRSVKHAQSGAAVAQVTLSNIDILGRRQTATDIQFFVKNIGLSRNISGDGDRLICNVECAFGAEEGLWEFTVSAPGFQDKRVSYDMRYAGTDKDECTTYIVGSFPVDIVLAPMP